MNLYNSECLDILKTLPENSIDSLVTDAPAGIAFMGKKWDEDKGGRDHWIAWMTEIMRETYRVLKPGAHGLVWALPRTSHWTATALENAGFEIRDVVTHLFGSGFPKSMDISKAIDKAAGAKREVVGFDASKARPNKERFGKSVLENTGHGLLGVKDNGATITAPATDAAKQWQGFGTALKPASEHWILVRKPLSEKTVAANVLKWGTGGINIDGCRIETSSPPKTCTNNNIKSNNFAGDNSDRPRDTIYTPNTQGRFPANLVFSHTPYCTESACFDGLYVLRTYTTPDKTVSALDASQTIFEALESVLLRTQNYNTNGNSLLSNAAAPAYTDHTAPFAFLSCDAVHGLVAIKSLDSLIGCQTCFRFYGELFRKIVMASQESVPSLRDALFGVYSDLYLSKHTQRHHESCQTSNAGDFPLLDEQMHTERSNKHFSLLVGDSLDTADVQQSLFDSGGNTVMNKKSVSDDNCEKTCHNDNTETIARLLWVFALVFLSKSKLDVTTKVERVQPDSCAIKMLDEQSGPCKTGELTGQPRVENKTYGSAGFTLGSPQFYTPDAATGASRFFYCAKISTRERNEGLANFPNIEITHKGAEKRITVGGGKEATPIVKNGHPTVKSQKLMGYLIRLATPPNGIVLDPFMGSGSTGCAAIKEGFDFVGIEKEKEYFEIAEARINFAKSNLQKEK